MNLLVLERAGAILALTFGVRALSQWRVARRERAALTTPLVDRAILEATFAPRAKDGDDADLLAELRDTFLHLNRRAYAEEFWGLHTQIVSLSETLGDVPRATLRRAVVRLITANDRWLQLVGAKTAAELGVTEAVPPLIAILEMGDSQRFSPDKAEYSASETADLRFRQELEQALTVLRG
jgi:hypothetical protein